jgi:predicted phosphodiesterase
MLYLRQLSDAHLEFHYDSFDSATVTAQKHVKQILPALATDKKSVLIIAGDLATIHTPRRIVNFLKLVQPRFRHVIYVLGNHEHYHANLDTSEDALLDAINESSLEKDAITVAGNRTRVVNVHGVRFICATLWSDFLNNSEQSKLACRAGIRDFHVIKVGSGADERLLRPDDLLPIFHRTVGEIEHALSTAPSMERTVVVTHHLPTMQAVDPRFTITANDRLLNGSFVSNLDELISKYQPAYWFFGHTHTPYRGKIGETQLVCNPIGYPGEHNVEIGRYHGNEVFSV